MAIDSSKLMYLVFGSVQDAQTYSRNLVQQYQDTATRLDVKTVTRAFFRIDRNQITGRAGLRVPVGEINSLPGPEQATLKTYEQAILDGDIDPRIEPVEVADPDDGGTLFKPRGR